MEIKKIYDGVVVDSATGRTIGLVKGNSILEIRAGGKPHTIGTIEDGVAYDFMVSGKRNVIGNVKYFERK